MRIHVLTGVMAGVLAVSAAAQTPMDVQPVKTLVPNGTLATCTYKPIAQEAPFFKRLSGAEKTNDAMFGNYTIHKKAGTYVSWFGIVRGILPAAQAGGEITLLVQHQYFDGLTDCHIMLVSKTGDGDFTARLKEDASAIPALALVRVYGKVDAEKDNVPQVAVEYIRVWPWMTFTFTDLGGDDHSNPRWAQYSRVKPGARIYVPYPDEDYYRAVLGDPAEFGANLKLE